MREHAMRRSVLAAWGLVIGLASLASSQVPAAPTSTARILPPAVLEAFQQAYPGAPISAASQGREKDRAVFRVDSLHNARQRVVLYNPDGSVIEVAEQVEEQELPRAVAAAMHSHPRAVYGKGMKITRGGRVHYELTLRGTRKTAMTVMPDGKVLSFK